MTSTTRAALLIGSLNLDPTNFSHQLQLVTTLQQASYYSSDVIL